MTREESIENLKGLLESNYVDSFEDEENESIRMAIQALEQKSNLEKICEELAAENDDLRDQLAMRDRFKQEPCEDAVSRQAVLKTLDNMDNVLDEDRTVENYKELLKECYEVLPPVRPQLCDDAISRKSLKQKLQEHHDFFVNAYGGFSNLPQTDKVRVDEIINCIAEVVNAPSIRPQEQTGHWINRHIIANKTIDMIVCSECGEEFSYDAETGISEYNYCPNCGARMFEPTCDTCKYTTAAFNPCNACKDKNEYEPQESEG